MPLTAENASRPGGAAAQGSAGRYSRSEARFWRLGTAGTLAAAAALFFFNLQAYGLWEPDEARYAEIAREMLALHDFIVPHLNYVAYVEKPPLLYWLISFFYSLFGVSVFAARIVPALSALAGLLAACFFARRAFGRRHALLGSAILATSPLYAVMAQVLTTDMLLTAMLTIALFAFFLHWREGARWRWLFYGAMGLAVLSKGPVGVVLPGLIVVLFLWWRQDLPGGIRRLRPVSGLLLTGLIAVPWFILISVREPDFIHFYMVGEHLRRFLDPNYSHGAPIYYYIPILIGGFLPWSLFLVMVRRHSSREPAWDFCLIATVTILVFFSLARAKLIPYILPAFPPMALLVADALLRFSDSLRELHCAPLRPNLRWFQSIGLIVIIGGLCAIGLAIASPHLRSPYFHLARPSLLAGGIVLAASGLLIGWAFASGRFEWGVAAMAAATALVLCVASYGRIEIESLRSYAAFSQTIARKEPKAELICYDRYVQALPFYTGKRVTVVGQRGELSYGLLHAKDGAAFFYTSDADLMRLWKESKPVVLILNQFDLDRLGHALGEYRLIASEHQKRAIVNASDELTGN